MTSGSKQIVENRSRVKISDVAQQAGVSAATVSMVMRNRDGIHPDTRGRVLAAAKTLGYRTGNGLPKRSTDKIKNIGLILKLDSFQPMQVNPFYSHVVAGIESACRALKINIMYTSMAVDDENRPTEIPSFVADADVDGLLLVGAFVDESLLPLLTQRHVPVVLVDGYSRSEEFDSVVSENLRGMYRATCHLIECGHREIGFIGSHPNAYPSLEDRRRGYMQALQEHGLTPHFADCASGLGEGSVAEVIKRLLKDMPELTAALACNDAVAIATLRALHALDRAAPTDLSLIGFDDIEASSLVTPALTTMQVDKQGMGRRAVDLLMHRAQFPDTAPVTVALHPRLVTRQSVLDLRSAK